MTRTWSTSTIMQRFNRMPRAARWAVSAGIVVILFLVYDEAVGPLTRSWNDQADHMLADVERAAGGRQQQRKLRSIKESVLALGPVQMPAGESEGNAELHAIVNDVLKRHPVSNDSFNYRGASKLPRGTLRSALDPGQRIERVSGDLRFDAEPDRALAIITEIEDSPYVESISSIRLTRQGGPRITVDLTIEAWIVGTDRGQRGLGGGA